MVKKYTKNMQKTEIFDRLRNNETIKIESGKTEYALNMYDNKIEFGLDGTGKYHLYIHCRLDILNSNLKFFFEDKEEFAVNVTGLYETRDGRKAFVSDVESPCKYGIIDGDKHDTMWTINGHAISDDIDSDLDLVSKWKE